nr:nucleotide-binding alpha-beta plait domain-containing protein [Tanacetum cinerariifolium]
MGSYRSKEDDVSRISTSIYFSNFPESFSAKDLFHSCKQYGHVVDTFIPFKRSKDGKRFAFVRFINVFNVERLVSNLCIIWVDRSKFHANIARFHKAPLNSNKVLTEQKFGYDRNINNVRAKEGVPTDLSKALLGRVKEFASLPNLKIVLKNEGFAEIKIHYMGEFWVVLEFPSIVWVEIEGVPFKLWSKNTFKRIAAKWGELLDVDDQEEEGFHSKRLCIYLKSDDSDDDDESDNGFKDKDGDAKVQDEGSCGDNNDEVEVPKTMFEESIEQKENQSKDPFGIYLLLNKNKDKSENMKTSDHSLKYPPGFTPNGDNNEFCMHEENVRSVNEANSLNCLAQMAKKDWVKELCIKNKMNFLAIQETKLENMDLWCVKACCGNYTFDFVHSDSVGNSRGILCIWDPNSFHKNNVTVLDYLCMVRGVWLKTGVDILMVVVYAPQELRDKRILWDYLEHVINQWDGEVVIMGDFNEVRFKSERFGLVFNVQGANVFNAFIANEGLEEVPLGGSSFTWCHKSATKMSKLD